MMNRGDMEHKRQLALKRVWRAIEERGGTTLLAGGLSANVAQIAKAVTEAGIRFLEPCHAAVARAYGWKGAVTPQSSREVRHEIPLDDVLKVIRGIRSAVSANVILCAGVPGSFTEIQPIELTDDDFRKISLAGADSIHAHKSTLRDLEELVRKAHKCGLLVDAYIDYPDVTRPAGIPCSNTRGSGFHFSHDGGDWSRHDWSDDWNELSRRSGQ
jgi:cyclase